MTIKLELNLEIDEMISLRNFLDDSLSERDMTGSDDESEIATHVIEILDREINRYVDAAIEEKNRENLAKHLKG